jgi:hypothetical protein
MRDNDISNAFVSTPSQLLANRGVADSRAVTSADQWSGDRCTVTDVKGDSGQGSMPLVDTDQIGHIEDAHPCLANAIANGWRNQRVLNRECLENASRYREWFPR